ncbi:beta-secretase 1-like [Physella acuta]|uniref:beta-secretase 1-like n=1 Tax=Physella acuta TaxID=109671 RepID=UPI0027DDDA63|nr:beta-secretase 1-like [Physella acuta]
MLSVIDYSHCYTRNLGDQMRIKKLSFSIVFIVILSLHSLLPTHAMMVYQFPLKPFKGEFNIDRNETLHRFFQRDISSSSMINNLKGVSVEGYFIDLDIGTPPQTLQVLVDTGSANFAVATRYEPNISKFFYTNRSSTFVYVGTSIFVPYTEGEWTGYLATDTVSLSLTPNISATVNIACITSSKNFFIANAEWQGILGLAYSELSRPDSSVTTYWDSLRQANPELKDVFSMLLCGSSFVHSMKPLMEGSLIFGAVNESLSKSPILYTPIYKKWYYEVVLSDIRIQGTSLLLDCKEYNFDKTIVDSGTTNIRLPNKVFDALVKSIDSHIRKNGIIDKPDKYFYTGDIQCFFDMALPLKAFPVVTFTLFESENISFDLHLTPQHYLRLVETDISNPLLSCVKFGFSSSTSGTVLGAVLMEAFYVVFDRNSSKIGFGQTTCPLPDPSHPLLAVTVEGPNVASNTLTKCAYMKPESTEKSFLILSYVMAGLSVVVILPLLLLCFFSIQKKLNRLDSDPSETQAFSKD